MIYILLPWFNAYVTLCAGHETHEEEGMQHEDEKDGESRDATIKSIHDLNLEPNHQCDQQNSRKSAQNLDL